MQPVVVVEHIATVNHVVEVEPTATTVNHVVVVDALH